MNGKCEGRKSLRLPETAALRNHPIKAAKRVDLYLHQQGLDSTTPAGKALFQMLGVFAEFERAIIRERVRSGLERAKAHGKTLGRRRNNDPARAAEVRRMRANGTGIGKIARTLGVGVGYVQRIVTETHASPEVSRTAIRRVDRV
jgi:DNA invertase Pin-like site-specific DNA recombinase